MGDVLFKKLDSELFVSIVGGNFCNKIVDFFKSGLMFSLSVLPDHFDVLFHLVISLIKILDEFSGFFDEFRIIVGE